MRGLGRCEIDGAGDCSAERRRRCGGAEFEMGMDLEMKWFSNLKLINGREQRHELEATGDELIPDESWLGITVNRAALCDVEWLLTLPTAESGESSCG